MKDYLQLDGLVYKLVPIRTPIDRSNPYEMGRVDSDLMYDIVKKWSWGNSESTDIYHDPETRNGIRKELNHLEEAGYLQKLKVNNKVEYKANTDHPLFDTLKKVVYKHLGLEDLVSTVIERMGNVKKIILIEDYAKGIDSKNIEVVLVGQYLNFEYISQLEEKRRN